MNMYNTKMVP